MTAADLFHRAATERFEEGDFLNACETCRAGLVTDPDHPALHELLGLACYELEDLGAAVHALETASLLAPLSPIGQLTLAELYTGFGLTRAAAAMYEFLAEPGRCPVPLLPAVARGLGRVGQYDLALTVCERIVELRPGFHPAHFGAAYYLSRLGYPPATVLPYLDAAVRLAPNSVSYRVSLAAAHVQLGRHAEAYPLLSTLPVERIHCPRCLARLLPAIESACDTDLATAYRERIDQLRVAPGSGEE